MNEKEYCIITNRVKISQALSILRGIMTGNEYGAPKDKLTSIVLDLTVLEEKLFHLVDEIPRDIGKS